MSEELSQLYILVYPNLTGVGVRYHHHQSVSERCVLRIDDDMMLSGDFGFTRVKTTIIDK